MRSVFLDTNVLVDFELGRGAARDCAKLFALCETHDIPLAVSVLSLKDVFFLVQSSIKRQSRADHAGTVPQADAIAAREIAWACVRHIDDLATVVGTARPEYRQACLLRPLHSDLEDNLVVACALHCGADLFVTSDEDLLRHCPIAALTPHDALLRVQAALGIEAPSMSHGDA